MNIQETITRIGVWEANPEASFHYREETYGFGIIEEEADKIVAKTTDARFAFRGNTFLHYCETRFGQMKVLKGFFQVDEFEKSIKIYKEDTFEDNPVLTFDVKSIDEKRLIFFLEEEEMYFVCDYTENKKKFPEE
jgi:hypothetical protein